MWEIHFLRGYFSAGGGEGRLIRIHLVSVTSRRLIIRLLRALQKRKVRKFQVENLNEKLDRKTGKLGAASKSFHTHEELMQMDDVSRGSVMTSYYWLPFDVHLVINEIDEAFRVVVLKLITPKMVPRVRTVISLQGSRRYPKNVMEKSINFST